MRIRCCILVLLGRSLGSRSIVSEASPYCWKEYLERMRSEFDSQLLLFRQLKHVCTWLSHARQTANTLCTTVPLMETWDGLRFIAWERNRQLWRGPLLQVDWKHAGPASDIWHMGSLDGGLPCKLEVLSLCHVLLALAMPSLCHRIRSLTSRSCNFATLCSSSWRRTACSHVATT